VSGTLELSGVSVRYGELYAVRDVSLSVRPGEVLCLIGETGCGKSSLALACARLLPSAGVAEGSIELDGVDLLAQDPRTLRDLRARRIGFVAQDSMAALNPVHRVGLQIAELFQVHKGQGRRAAWKSALDCLEWVWIQDPDRVARLYPHQLSGGMRQRVMIALALALEPPLILADEPTTALDVSTQAEIVALIARLRRELGSSVLWITHDMGLVAEMADSVAVMYAGRIVEQGPVERIFDTPRHHYTAALLRTLHDLRDGEPGAPMYQVDGRPPALGAGIPGCPFHPRCPVAGEVCARERPAVERHGDVAFACHRPLEALEAVR
jgi:oligopeptide/dipeptide ABC transporter ATP-binding protein